MKTKSCLTNLISFCDKYTCLGNERFVGFRRASTAISHSILLDTQLDSQVWAWRFKPIKVVVNGVTPGCWPNKSRAPHSSTLGPAIFSVFINDPANGVECTLSKSAHIKLGVVDSLEALQRCTVCQCILKALPASCRLETSWFHAEVWENYQKKKSMFGKSFSDSKEQVT